MNDQLGNHEGFRDWIDRHPGQELAPLPLTHSTKAYNGEMIIRAKEIVPLECPVFDEVLSYFYYGRPAYRTSTDTTVQYEAASPYCFIFSPDLLSRAKQIFPFDTGAYNARLYKHVLIDEIKLDDFSLRRRSDRIEKLISAIFSSRTDYFDSNRNAMFDPEASSEAWEMAARAYLNLGNYILDVGNAEMDTQKRQASAFDCDTVPSPQMIEAGVDALLQFEDGDGSTLAERVAEVFLSMISQRATEKLLADRVNFRS